MDQIKINGIIRHVITTLGGFLVAFGWIGEDIVSQSVEALMQISGGVFIVFGIIKSFKAKEKQTVQ